ncbi:hypothetical protein [Vibrio mediterranei]|uniref:hypothetical protein n=1 Tax=Vibrio mediterranei TaxID=689 RepID=UPI00148DB143|nr:hypothetical protein [Vibrio mediterranei]
MTNHHTDDWVCLEDGEDDYVIERVELRVKGKKPLVLNNPARFKSTEQFQIRSRL